MTAQRWLVSLKTIVLYVLLLVFLTPFLVIIMNSFKTTEQFVDNPLSLPQGLTLDNYTSAWDSMNFWDGFMNSLTITVLSVLFIQLYSWSFYPIAVVHFQL